MSDNPQDGFDLIEYPCSYAFKAMCYASAEQSAQELIKALVEAEMGAGFIESMKTNASRTGKFESVTVTVQLSSRNQLEVIYKAIAGSPRVVMTL